KRIKSLEAGQWQNGTRVKKLKALSSDRLVFEARIDEAKRMLFSFYPTKDEKSALVIFHLALQHDDVIRTARTILNENYEVSHYELEEAEEENVEDLVVNTKKYWNQPMHHNEFINLKKYEVDEDTIIRLMKTNDLGTEEMWELKLALHKEQQEVLETPLPVLMSGTAGSGKTTIAIYKLLVRPELQKLYITYSRELCEEAKLQFQKLVYGLDDESTFMENTTFMTFDDVLKKYKLDEYQAVSTQNRLIHEYKKFARGSNKEKESPALMVWEELRGVWKRRLVDGKIDITLDEYMSLSEKEAPNFYSKRSEAYKIYEWYKDLLKANHMVDEQDLLFEILAQDLKTYDLVIADEIQDLTPLHLKVIFKFADNEPQRLMLTGDDHQVVHYSGFRWENIKNALHNDLNTKVKDIVKLSKNYRNSGTIALLADSVNQLQTKYTEFRYKTKSEEYHNFGSKPILYENIEETKIIDFMSSFGPYDAVLVRGTGHKKELHHLLEQNNLDKPLIFSVNEAKGLEFKKVFIWKMYEESNDYESRWKRIKRIIDKDINVTNLDNIQQRFIRYEASLLYVAITRGINQCQIYDGKLPSTVWDINDIRENLEIKNEINIEGKTEFNEEDWKAQGNYLFEKGKYEQALDCYRKAKPDTDIQHFMWVCTAHLSKEEFEFEQAAEIFESVNMLHEAIECWDALGEYEQIIKMAKKYSRIKENKQNIDWEETINAYKVKHFDKIKKWSGSAIYYRRSGNYVKALERYKLGGENAMIHHMLEELLENPEKLNEKLIESAIDYYSEQHNDHMREKYIQERMKI
ncbi:UvrD-helicase domain-containing protein, partial [Marinococcus halophilus]